MAIKCCNGCVPPKRTPWCHCSGNCPEHDAQKAQHEKERAEIVRKRDVQYGLTAQTYRSVDRARYRKKMKGR